MRLGRSAFGRREKRNNLLYASPLPHASNDGATVSWGSSNPPVPPTATLKLPPVCVGSGVGSGVVGRGLAVGGEGGSWVVEGVAVAAREVGVAGESRQANVTTISTEASRSATLSIGIT